MIFCFLRLNIAIWESRFTLLTAVLKISLYSQNIDSSSRASIAFFISISVGDTFGSWITKSISVLSSSSGPSPRISAMISASLDFSPFVDALHRHSKDQLHSTLLELLRAIVREVHRWSLLDQLWYFWKDRLLR